ncbi:MAG: glycerate 2-kinase, partial [Gemmatimonadales bacterium]|nr:glycerate 2-kinase [Gemmatimonadales bacterium]
SLHAGEHAYRLLEGATEHDLVLVLLSGGGSALITWPDDDLTLTDMRTLTNVLLRSGATINEVNALRRRCDRVKGGGLLQAALPATIAVLALSDVIGDDLAAIASGPFLLAGVGSQRQKVVDEIVARYRLAEQLPGHLVRFLAREPRSQESSSEPSVPHTIIANVAAAARGALDEAQARGLATELITSSLHGEARDVGAELARQLASVAADRRPCCLIAGGETTVTIRGDGLGGRNQELALAAVEPLAGHQNLLLIALATDGGDGPTDAAGAVVDGDTLQNGQMLALDPREFLWRNDAYHYFEALGDLLKPGPTQTNVNDLVLLFAF